MPYPLSTVYLAIIALCCSTIVQAQKTDTTSINALLIRSRDMLTTNIDSSLMLAEQAIELSGKSGYTRGTAKGYNTAGVALMNHGDYTAAFDRYTKAAAAYRKLGDSSGVAQVYSMRGVCYGMQNRPAEALQWFLRSLRIREQLKDQPAIADLNLKIALVYDLSGDLDKALQYTLQSLEQSSALNDKKGMMTCYNNLGMFYGKQQDYAKALEVLDKAKELATEMQMIKVLGDIELNKGKVYTGLRRFDASVHSLQASLDHYKKVNFPLGIARVYNALGEGYLNSGSYKAAQDAAKESMHYAYAMGNTRLLYDNYDILAEASQKTGDYRKALEYTDSLLVLKDSIYAADKNELLQRTQHTYELEKKESAIHLLEKENIAATTQRNMFIIIAACTILIFCTIGWMYFQSRKKNRVLAQQKATLQEMNRVRDKFISLLSHDIRTPLAGIISVIDLLTQQDLPYEERQRIWVQLRSSTAATLDTLESMLFWARNQLRNTPLHKEKVDLEKLAAEITALYETTAQNKQVNVVNNVAHGTVVSFDKDQLAFILRNLVANAVKFSYPGSSVVIGAGDAGGSTMLTVSDSGMGMSEGQVQALLSGKGSVVHRGTVGEQGSGIGLVMVKDFVDNHGAIMEIASKKGEGAVFKIKIG